MGSAWSRPRGLREPGTEGQSGPGWGWGREPGPCFLRSVYSRTRRHRNCHRIALSSPGLCVTASKGLQLQWDLWCIWLTSESAERNTVPGTQFTALPELLLPYYLCREPDLVRGVRVPCSARTNTSDLISLHWVWRTACAHELDCRKPLLQTRGHRGSWTWGSRRRAPRGGGCCPPLTVAASAQCLWRWSRHFCLKVNSQEMLQSRLTALKSRHWCWLSHVNLVFCGTGDFLHVRMCRVLHPFSVYQRFVLWFLVKVMESVSLLVHKLASFYRDCTLLFCDLFPMSIIDSGAWFQSCFLCCRLLGQPLCHIRLRKTSHTRLHMRSHRRAQRLLLCVPEGSPAADTVRDWCFLGVFRPGFWGFLMAVEDGYHWQSSFGRHHLGGTSSDLSSFHVLVSFADQT